MLAEPGFYEDVMYRQHIASARAVFSTVLSLLFAGCQGTSVAPNESLHLPLAEQGLVSGQSARRVAWIGVSGDSALISVPATARTGVPSSVEITTYAGGCIAEDTIVATVIAAGAEVVPYQRIYTPRANEGCTDELRVTQRTATVVFAAAGPAQVVVIGRLSPTDSLVRFTRTIAVQ
ncbi:MAG TPA: hypothetical protein VIG47_03015 [Gemmatimonadaceae bacterium]|jgi:hypothetical protein